MKFPSFIISKLVGSGRWAVVGGVALVLTFALASTIYAERIALLTPEKSLQSEKAQEKLEDFLAKKFKILDDSLTDTVLKTSSLENPFNLLTKNAQNFGTAVGCDFFIILKAENLRRASLSKGSYYESYMTAYLVSTRTGRLVFWTLKSFEAETAENADKKLFDATENLAREISTNIETFYRFEINETAIPDLEELPEENSPESKNFRSPLPFKRLRPVYTPLANLYSITATVDALVDLDENGQISRIEIIRWAGYGLDESVIKTIREMQWRAASRDGKTLPIRVLLRYNFKKLTDNK